MAPVLPVRHDWRLIPAASAVWLGTIWAVAVPATAARTAAALGGALTLFALAVLVWARRAYPLNAQVWQRAILIGVLTCGLLAGVLGVVGAHQARWEASDLYRAQQARAYVKLTGSVISDVARLRTQTAPPWQGERWRATVAVSAMQYRGSTTAASARLTIIGGPELGELQPGQLFAIGGKLRPTDASNATRAVLFTNSPPELLGDPSGVYAWGGDLRARFRTAAQTLPGNARGLVPGMVVGDTSQISDEVDQSLRDTSLTHLTAVSGAHCTLIIGAALALARPPRTWSLKARRLVRAGAAGAVLAGFIIATGPQPSVLRAGVMGTVGLMGLIRGRRSRAISALAVAVIVLLFIDPWLARNIGFCLSVLSTAAIVLTAGPVGQWLERWLPKPLALGLAVSASAQIACIPVLLLIDPRLTMYSLPANVIATPLLPFVSLPGAAGLALMLLFPPLAPALLWVAALPAQAIGGIARAFAGLPGATIPWPPPPGVWWAFGCLMLAGIFGIIFRSDLRARPRYYAVLTCIAVLSFWIISGTAPGIALRELAGWQDPQRHWFAAQCDVGQGDALVIRSHAGSVVMIDVGLPGEAAADCLKGLDVQEIDLLVLTHWHLDHVGGIEPVLAHAPVRQVLIPAWNEPNATARPARAALAETETVRALADENTASLPEVDRSLPGIEWDLIWPTGRALELTPAGAADGTSVNDLSTVLLLRIETVGGEVSLLALGDVEEVGQRGVQRELTLRGSAGVDVLKMAHHGSSRQSEPLAEMVNPRAVLIGVGADNDYGHPSDRAWKMYADQGALIGSTDRHGRVTLIAERTGEIKMLLESRSGS